MKFMDERYLKIWGKTEPYQPLLYHMIDTGNVTLSLLSTNAFSVIKRKFSSSTGCPVEHCASWLAYLVALHDIGKCDPDFQAKAGDELIKPLQKIGLKFRSIPDIKFRHEVRSSKWINDYLREQLKWGRKPSNTISDAIRSHHSNLENRELDDDTRLFQEWEALRNELAEQVLYIFKPPCWTPTDFKDNSCAGLLLSGLIVFSDWIASNVELMNYVPNLSIKDYYSESIERAKKAVNRLGLDDTIDWTGKSEFSQVWASEKFPSIRPIQSKCVDVCNCGSNPRFVIIEAPMGEGKTEAAIYLATKMMTAGNMNGMYIALPTAATSNQMYTRVKALLNAHGLNGRLRLVHGMAWLIDDETLDKCSHEIDTDAVDWFRPKKRSLLSPYAVGTVDQALMSALNVRFGFLRLFGLSGKILIIDEVHAYDAYMSNIMVTLLKWCSILDIPVILLSATLPYSKKETLLKAYCDERHIEIKDRASYPIITYVADDREIHEVPVEGASRRINVKLVKHYGIIDDSAAIARLAFEKSKNGGCICVIMNTVKSAQNVYSELEKLCNDDTRLLLFHARFRAKEREIIEKAALSLFDKRSLLPEGHPQKTLRPPKAILVATQVVEQSLDLDFDEIITDIAPIDLILQRTGRLHRHDRKNRPTGEEPRLHLLLPASGKPDFGHSNRVYSRFYMLKTLQTLSILEEINLPTDIKRLVENTYDENIEECACEPYTITKEDLCESLKELKRDRDEKTGLSNQYLISDPRLSEYSIAIMQSACKFKEDDDGACTYFNARTRVDDDTISIIVLDNSDFDGWLNDENPPTRDILRQIYLNMVNVPRWWLDGCVPIEGFKEIESGKKCLMSMPILKLNSGIWEGYDKNNKKIRIANDKRLGMIREELIE